MRIFLGVPIPPSVQQEIHVGIRHIHDRYPSLTWVPPANYHITLLFIGEADLQVCDRIRHSLGGMPPAQQGFDVTLSGVGTFPEKGPPKVLFVSVGEGHEECRRLYADIVGRPEMSGYADSRPYHPHVTCARIRRPGTHLTGLEAQLTIRFRAACITLFESMLGAGGARYRSLADVRLPEASSASC